MVRVFGQKLGVFVTKIVIRSNFLNNLNFYLPEFMPKRTETSKNVKFLEKIAKISKFSEKIAKISKFLEQTANFWKELQKSQSFG